MNPFFKNINIFLARKIIFFNENFRKIELILQRFLHFSKSYFTNFKFYGGEFYYQVRILSKISKNGLDRAGMLAGENYGNFWRKLTEIC